jgi:hypothetical protein
LVGIAASKAGFHAEQLAKSTLAPMVNRVLTSPYLWWFDWFPVGPQQSEKQVPRPLLKVLALQTWQ